MGFDASQFLKERGESAINTLLSQPTRRVVTGLPAHTTLTSDTPTTPLAEAVYDPLRQFYQNIIGGGATESASTAGNETTPRPTNSYDAGLEEVYAYIPLTEEEMIASAQSKAEMYGALMAMAICAMKSFAAKLHLKKEDKKLVEDYDREVRITGNRPVYDTAHPYYTARERYNEFERLMQEAELDSALSEGQQQLLYRALFAQTRHEDKQKRLKPGSVWGAVSEIFFSKMAESAITIMVNQIIRIG